MIDLARDPSETRATAGAVRRRSPGRPWRRIVLFGVLGLAGAGAFANVASRTLSDLAGPRRAPAAIRQNAADWPDLKDGLPALTGGSLPAVVSVREIPLAEPVRPDVVEARAEPPLRLDPVSPSLSGPTVASVSPSAPHIVETGPDRPRVARPSPAIIEVPLIGPARQADLVVSLRTVPALAPRAAETVRARTGDTTLAALPPEPDKTEFAKTEPAKAEPAKTEATRAKPRVEAQARAPAGEKPAARKPAALEARATPVEAPAEDEDTEVFGIKIPSLAPAGRKIRESVDALGAAVKGLPDRF